ncbi:MAG: metal ABC transporter ATP-binding protein [Paenibacillaceae bacterium]|nr:metal ABC transporter ATP-binding protein [Paenibacillaceae bacterium]
MTTMIEVDDATVRYGGQCVLEGATFRVQGGRMAAIVGPNGAGKSTLLKAMLGLVRMERGTVRICGEPLRRMRARVAYVPQRSAIDWDFPISVRDVVVMGTYASMRWWHRPGAAARLRAEEALDQVNMRAFADRHIRALSGGQQQRVFLARALAQRASVIVLDEPFAGVDVASEQAIIAQLRTLRDQGVALLIVHHELNTVEKMFDDVILLRKRIVAQGDVATAFTREAIAATYGTDVPRSDIVMTRPMWARRPEVV